MESSTLPPRDLAARILGVPSDEHTYPLYDRSGRVARDTIVSLLGPDFTFAGKRVLDFGCGTGRVLRHFQGEAEECEFWACDSHGPSAAWCQEHLPMHCFENSADPPLDVPDGHFDLVIAIAVFTHLVHNWSHWLAEMQRILRPGGLMVATFHSCGLWHCGFAARTGAQWDEDRTGMHVEFYEQTLTDSCGSAVWLSEWWLRQRWGRAFEILSLRQTGFAPGGTQGDEGQGSVLARRRSQRVTPEELQRPSTDPREAAARSEAEIYCWWSCARPRRSSGRSSRHEPSRRSSRCRRSRLSRDGLLLRLHVVPPYAPGRSGRI